jgi:hypothetical protein
MYQNPLSRRSFIQTSSAAGLAAATSSLLAAEEHAPSPQGKAEHCIFIWLGGGAAHIDTFDPKRRGDAKAKKAGSYYDSIDTAIEGVQVCEHLKRLAPLMDRCVPVRTLNHDVIDEHAAAVNRMHTGRPTSGTVIYPSVGSVVSYKRGAAAEGVPPYVVMGYPNLTRGPGFLGAKYSYLYLIDTKLGPPGLRRPYGVSEARQDRRQQLLAEVRQQYAQQHPRDAAIGDYTSVSEEGFRLTGKQFMSVFELEREPARVRESYGGEFGQRCLLARRLVEGGVRFVEVSFNLNFINGTGWDTHNEGQLNQHILIDQLDQALAALITDLQEKKLLDKTLIAIGTEFGRPAQFDGGGGRGHYSKAFSGFLAGGGLRTGQAIGTTDELGQVIVDRPVSVPDYHATMYAALGIDPAEELFDGERPIPITDRGRAIAELF